MTKHSAPCPICSKPAKQTAAKAGDYTEIDCKSCGRFQVSEPFQQAVSGYPLTIRLQSLDRAKLRSRYGLLPIVTTYDLP